MEKNGCAIFTVFFFFFFIYSKSFLLISSILIYSQFFSHLSITLLVELKAYKKIVGLVNMIIVTFEI